MSTQLFYNPTWDLPQGVPGYGISKNLRHGLFGKVRSPAEPMSVINETYTAPFRLLSRATSCLLARRATDRFQVHRAEVAMSAQQWLYVAATINLAQRDPSPIISKAHAARQTQWAFGAALRRQVKRGAVSEADKQMLAGNPSLGLPPAGLGGNNTAPAVNWELNPYDYHPDSDAGLQACVREAVELWPQVAC